jgi:hypothetical protein
MGQYYSPVSKMDVDNSGVVDNSERLGGQLPSYYLTKLEYDILTANRSYYVNSDSGDDSNSGRASGEAFATLDKAFSILSTLDANGYRITINFEGTFDVPENGWIVVPPSRCRELSIRGDDWDTTVVRFVEGSYDYGFIIRNATGVVSFQNFVITHDNDAVDHWYWTSAFRSYGQYELDIEEIKFELPQYGECRCLYLSGATRLDIEDCTVVGNELNVNSNGDFLYAQDDVIAKVYYINFVEANFYSLINLEDSAKVEFGSFEGTLRDGTRRFVVYDEAQIAGYTTDSLSGGVAGEIQTSRHNIKYQYRETVNWDSEYTLEQRHDNWLLVKDNSGDIEYIVPTEEDSNIHDRYKVTILKKGSGECRIHPDTGVSINGSTDDIVLSNVGDYIILSKIGGSSWETIYGRASSKVNWSDVVEVSGAEIKSLYESQEDTNVFTDAEKTKLSNTETTTQLNNRDTANRARSNHTGTQTSSTISDFQSAVTTNTNVAANTAARHSAVSVTDSSTIDFTLTGQNITGIVKDASIDTAKLSTGVNTSLSKADSAVQTGSQIKSLYEAQPNTNAYDDTEKAKVASLYFLPVPTVTSNHTAVTKTLVPCDSSGGSFTITLPTTGSLKIVDVVGTDINTGFGVNPVTLVPQGAQTIAGGEDDLVLDAGGANVIISLVGDDWRIIDLTVPALRVGPEWGDILDKPNFGSAALTDTSNYALAAQGAKADNAVQLTGDQSIGGKKTFTSPLILPDNSRINGVEHFYRSTKPTVRGDSSALVAGDRWYKTDDGTEWWWNGTYWLSAEKVITSDASGSLSDLRVYLPLQESALIVSTEFILYSYSYFDNINISNHHFVNVSFIQNTGGWVDFGTIPTYNTFTGVGDLYGRSYAGRTAIGDFNVIVPINQVVLLDLGTFQFAHFKGLRYTLTAVGFPPEGTLSMTRAKLKYRTII